MFLAQRSLSAHNDGPWFNLVFTQNLSQRRQCHLMPSKDFPPAEHVCCTQQKKLDGCMRTHERQVRLQSRLPHSLDLSTGEILSSLCLVTQAVDFPLYGARQNMQLQQEGYQRTSAGTTGQALINVLVCPTMVLFT